VAYAIPTRALAYLTHSDSKYNSPDVVLEPARAAFFVIKSNSEDDVHKSVKYNIWTSTPAGNKRLNAAFSRMKGHGPVYLFFSVNRSRHFCGVAEMQSLCNLEKISGVWMEERWKGEFKLKWIIVKDVPMAAFDGITVQGPDGEVPFGRSRDTQELPLDIGKRVLKIMAKHKPRSSIFDDFEELERAWEQKVSLLSLLTPCSVCPPPSPLPHTPHAQSAPHSESLCSCLISMASTLLNPNRTTPAPRQQRDKGAATAASGTAT
jgi:hypothetical protein